MLLLSGKTLLQAVQTEEALYIKQVQQCYMCICGTSRLTQLVWLAWAIIFVGSGCLAKHKHLNKAILAESLLAARIIPILDMTA